MSLYMLFLVFPLRTALSMRVLSMICMHRGRISLWLPPRFGRLLSCAPSASCSPSESATASVEAPHDVLCERKRFLPACKQTSWYQELLLYPLNARTLQGILKTRRLAFQALRGF